MSDMGNRGRPGGNCVSRRAICAGMASLVGVGLPGLARASDEDVLAAIAKDFGLTDPAALPIGDVQIDMPDFSDSGKSVPLTVSIPCSMQGLDYPEAVSVYAARNPRPRIAQVRFTPACSKATFSTRVRIDSFQDIVIVVKMATGHVFKGVRKVDVTYGACEDAVANDQFPPGWAPRIRVAAPALVAADHEFEVRTIIGHPMETGFRHNAQGLTIPVRIAEWFGCYADDVLVFSVKLEPAISANPYFAFFLTLQKTTRLRFEWVDTTSEVYSDEATVLVG